MKSQRDTSLWIRLAGTAILGLFIALAAAAYFSGQQVKRGSELITTDAVPGTIIAHSLRMAMSRSVGFAMVAASAETTQSRDASLKIAHNADVDFTNAVKEYETTILIDPEKDRALLERVTSRFAEYHRQRMAYEALILAGDRSGSAAFLERDLVPVYASATQSAQELLDYNHANSLSYANYIRDSVHRLYLTVAVVMVLSLICAAVLIVNLSIRRRELMELRESEEKYRDIVEQSPLGIFQSSVEGRLISVNSALATLFGYATSELMLNDETFLAQRFYRQEQRQEVVRAASESPVSIQREIEYRRRNGTVFTANLYMRAVRAANGTIQYLEGFVEDITERNRVMEQLEMLKVSIDKHFDAAYWMDTNNQFVYVNDSACKALGYTREELLGQPVTMLAPKATPHLLEEVWKSLRETGFFNRESEHRRKDGSEFPVDIVATYVRFEGKEFNCSFARDITERKRTQEELISKTALLEAQLDSTLDGILVVDTQGRRVLQNRRFLEMFKVPEEVGGGSGDTKMLRHAVSQMKSPEQFRERVTYLYAHPDEVGRDEIELTDGRVFDRYSAPVRDKAGKHYGRIWVFRDITERRRTEVQLCASNEALRESEQRLRLALDAGQIGVWHQDDPAGAFSADDRLFDLFGVPLNELRSMPFETFLERVQVDDRKKVVSELRSLWEGAANAEAEFRAVRPDGATREVVGSGVSVSGEDGKVKRVVGITIDVTERKQAEKERETLVHELREHQKNLESLVASRTKDLSVAK